MESYARKLFGIAGLFNFVVALALLFLRPQIVALLRLDPVSGSNLQIVNALAMFIAIFGYTYWRVAADPERYRPYIGLGAVGKMLVFAALAWPWLDGEAGWQLPMLASADLVFAVLFLLFLRDTRISRGRQA